MKQKDIPVLLAIVIIAVILSLVVTQTLFVPKSSKVLTAERVDTISAEFKEPDTFIFNKDALNPTQLIKIGDSNNNNSQ